MKAIIQSIHFNADDKLLSFIQKKLLKLSKILSKVHYVNIFLQLENNRLRANKTVEIMLNFAHKSIVVKKKSKTFESAVNQTINLLKQKLVKQKDKKQY